MAISASFRNYCILILRVGLQEFIALVWFFLWLSKIGVSDFLNCIQKLQGGLVTHIWWYTVPGGTQIWVGQGCAARASKPLPIFKGDFGRKGYPFFKDFSWKIGPFFKHFTILGVFAIHVKTQKFELSQKSLPMFKDFLVKYGIHV